MTRRPSKNYTPEFKESAAKLAVESDQSISQIARELGVHVTTLHGWVSKFYPNRNIRPINEADPMEELKRLRKENARLREERDILKKATAYFAKEMK
jgi:transposase